MLEGIIIKGIGGFYYVKVEDVIYECRARGAFRKDKITPLVGDEVAIQVTDGDQKGYIQEIYPRKTQLIRPPVANVDHAVIVFALKSPDLNLWLLDRFLLLAEYQNLEITICINKIDLGLMSEVNRVREIYESIGYTVLITNALVGDGIPDLKQRLKGKVSVFAGPSGVGKSTLLNTIQPNLSLKTGDISNKTKRGKHTTRWAELLPLVQGGWVVDTAGFSSLTIDYIKDDILENYFPEIEKVSHLCKFTGCRHNKEPKCAVKQGVDSEEISQERYNNYLKFLQEIIDNRRY